MEKIRLLDSTGRWVEESSPSPPNPSYFSEDFKSMAGFSLDSLSKLLGPANNIKLTHPQLETSHLPGLGSNTHRENPVNPVSIQGS